MITHVQMSTTQGLNSCVREVHSYNQALSSACCKLAMVKALHKNGVMGALRCGSANVRGPS